MAAVIPMNTDEYRIVLVDSQSSWLFASEREGQFHLVRVTVSQGTRVARQLQAILREVWGLSVLILEILVKDDSVFPCAVAELLHREVPAELKCIHPEQIPDDELSQQERLSLQAMLRGDVTNPFVRIGWIDEAIAWVESSTGKRVISKGGVEQHNAGGAFALVRFPMEDGCDCWLKATGAPNTHERTVTSLLSELCRGYVPEIVAERPEWNAWLMRGEDNGTAMLPREASGVTHVLKVAAESLAALQVRTMGWGLDLLEAGAFDQRTHLLRTEADALFAYVDEAMGLQTSTKVPRVETKRLRELQSIFEDACSHMEDLAIPNTILHGDLNLDNILVASGHCLFIDWCEAYVGSPLTSFEHLLLLNQIEDPSVKASCNRQLRETYKTAMSGICDAKTIDAGFACAPMVAAVSAIFGRGDWLRTPTRNDPRRQAYVRRIARHMDRAAREPGMLRALSV